MSANDEFTSKPELPDATPELPDATPELSGGLSDSTSSDQKPLTVDSNLTGDTGFEIDPSRPARKAPSRPRFGSFLPPIWLLLPIVANAIAIALLLVLIDDSLGTHLILALIPASIVFLAITWIDRPEPEPPTALYWTFAIGATSAFTAALALETRYTGIPIALAAGIFEESTKFLALLMITSRWRRIDTALNGAVYAMTLAAGLAFTENIFYFINAAEEGDLASTFVQRGLITPFAHPLFSLFFGLAVGASFGQKRLLRWSVRLAGLAAAAALHTLWDVFALAGDIAIVYVFVPFFIIVAVTLGLFRRQQLKQLVIALGEPVAHLLAPIEVRYVTDMSQRSRTRRRLPIPQRAAFDAWCSVWARARVGMTEQQIIDLSVAAAPWRSGWGQAMLPITITPPRQPEEFALRDPASPPQAERPSTYLDTDS